VIVWTILDTTLVERYPSLVPHDAFPIRTVAQQTGLTPDLIRAWERRYGVVNPVRGPRGSRLYTREDISHLRMLARAVASGRSIGDVAALDGTTLHSLVTPAGAATPRAAPAADILARLLAAIESFETAAIDRLLGDAVMALGTGPFIRRVARPLLIEVGARTSDGRLGIADEHLVSGLMRNLLSGIVRGRGQAHRQTVLLATPSGERHEFGLLLAALHVLESGLGVCYLGVDLPVDQVRDAARRASVGVVGMGVVDSGNRARAVADLRWLEAAVPPATELWLGGADADAVARELAPTRFLQLDDADRLAREAERIGMSVRP
jgi:DNA-binding transcriptional MerR regulator/methylmalonyl-CoA mutase cobalamin-binding subunit